MKLFVDASALVAIMAGEPDNGELSARMANYADRYISPIAVWETVVALHRSYCMDIEEGRRLVDRYLAVGDIKVASIDAAYLALDAYTRFGKGRHPAALNMGDCFAYACAKALGADLLSKGDDFARTDLAMSTDSGASPDGTVA